MKISAINTYNSYYYNPNGNQKLKTVKKISKVINTKRDYTYQTNLYDDSAQYVKNAYVVSFRPLEMIKNLKN